MNGPLGKLVQKKKQLFLQKKMQKLVKVRKVLKRESYQHYRTTSHNRAKLDQTPFTTLFEFLESIINSKSNNKSIKNGNNLV